MKKTMKSLKNRLKLTKRKDKEPKSLNFDGSINKSDVSNDKREPNKGDQVTDQKLITNVTKEDKVESNSPIDKEREKERKRIEKEAKEKEKMDKKRSAENKKSERRQSNNSAGLLTNIFSSSQDPATDQTINRNPGSKEKKKSKSKSQNEEDEVELKNDLESNQKSKGGRIRAGSVDIILESPLEFFKSMLLLGNSLVRKAMNKDIRSIVILMAFTSCMMVFLGFFHNVISAISGCCYPAYMSFKALSSERLDDDRKWLVYWTVYGFLKIWEPIIYMFLKNFPYFPVLECLFLVWLYHDSTNGSKYIYDNYIQPTFLKHEKNIDHHLRKVGYPASLFYNSKKEKNEENEE